MADRTNALRGILKDSQLDGMLVTKQQNWHYLSGFTGSTAIMVITGEDNYLITDFRYIEQAVRETSGFHVIKPYALIEDALVEQVNKLGLKRLGFESEAVSYDEYSSYKEKMPDVEMVPLREAVEKLRWVKSSDEVDLLREAARITDMTFDYILDFIKPGVRESEIALEMEYFMKRKGAERVAFDTIVASGHRAALPHGAASSKEIATGDMVVIDFGAVINGYHSDMTRTIIVGEPNPQQRKIYELVLRAQLQALEFVKPGIKCSAVDQAARDVISSEGYGPNFGHSLGHSVGLEIHEKPSFSPKDETVLESGMVLSVEPGIYLSDWGGVRIEDLVLLTPDGYELLSKSHKELIQL